MSQSFPTTVPSYPDTTGSEVLGSAGGGRGLSRILDDYGLDISAIAAKLGTGADTPASGQVLRGNGAGTSEWADLDLSSDVTGLLPAANLATFSSATLRGLLTDETGTGAAVFADSPVILTPTIASFVNANHNHTNSAGGGTLPAAAVPSLALNTQSLSNPYKFSAYRNAAQTPGVNGVIEYDTELFDTNSNFDVTTNKGRYTVAVNGFYQINVTSSIAVTAAPQDPQITLRKNGSTAMVTVHMVNMYNGNSNQSLSLSTLVQVTAGDYLEVITGSALALSVGITEQNFSGFLVSQT